MNVWVRIVPHIRTDGGDRRTSDLSLSTSLSLYIYPSEDAARVDSDARGGVVLEVNASSLGGSSEFDKTVYLTASDDENENVPTTAFLCMAYGTLEHTWKQEKGVATFPAETLEWFNAFEKETGFELEQ
jgi:hypothetical protein